MRVFGSYIVALLFGLLLQLYAFNSPVSAQQANETLPAQQQYSSSSDDVKVPGISCGIADSSKATACCISEEDFPDEKPPGLVEKVARRIGLGMISNLMQKKRELNNELNRIQKNAAKNAKKCLSGEPHYSPANTVPNTAKNCTCVDPKTDEKNAVTIMCKKYLMEPDNPDIQKERLTCVNCAQSSGYWSSFGCIPLNLGDLISKVILNVGIGLGGFVAILCVTLNAIRLQLSRGDSSKIQSVRENMTSCILGLVLILFSVFILRIVDITILGGIFGN
ncbi:hypothetical protein KBC70_03680 [Candidatus Woesebacteria bacterium]|nr:hypothetical protein [Candidatus Woesebacteria bacterium]